MNSSGFEKSAFWNKLSESEKKSISNSIKILEIEKGKIISRTSESCQGAILIKKGGLRIFINSPEGREITLYHLEEGEICVLSASCLLDSIQFDVVIEASQNSTAEIIPTQVLNPIVKNNPYVELFLAKTANERFSDVIWTLQQILFFSADKRIASYLWDESARYSADILTCTHEEIAKSISSAREVVTKTLNYLAKEQIVKLSRGKIEILNKEKLQKLL